MSRRQWSDLDQGTRRLILVGGALEGVLKMAALIDLRRRPAAEVRGRKWVWAAAVVLINSVGAAPAAYFIFGRRRSAVVD